MPRESYGPGGGRFVEFDPCNEQPASATEKAEISRAYGLRNEGLPASLNGETRSHGPTVEIICASEVTPEPVRWIWDGWLAHGKLHLLAGMAGTGKTTIALSWAAAITSGGRWPDGANAEPGDVLIWSGEDGMTDTLMPRLLAAGAAPGRVHFIGGLAEAGKSRPFDPANDMPNLAASVRPLSGLKLVILDPVVAAVAGDSHKNAETRRSLQPVVDLARELDCAVIGISHFAKSTSGREPLERVVGSLAFGAMPRVVMLTVKHADPDAPRRLVRAKSNLGPDTGGFEYQLFAAPVPGHNFTAQRIDWGAPLEGPARELLAVEQPNDDGKAMDEAEAFLLDILQKGPVPTKELKAAAQANGCRWRTVERAKDRLGVTAIKGGFASGWMWQLPPAPKTANWGDEDRQPN